MYTSSTVELNGQKLQFYANAVKIAISSNVIINTGQKIVDTCTNFTGGEISEKFSLGEKF